MTIDPPRGSSLPHRLTVLVRCLWLPLLFTLGCRSEVVYPVNERYEFKPHTVLEGTDTVKTFTLPKEKAVALEALLLPFFGSPRQPLVKLDEVATELASLKLDPETLAAGSKFFLIQCAHCHGREGNGLGKSAEYMNPKPRDFRQGKFKYVTTVRKNLKGELDTALASFPARADLHKTIYHGLPGAGMTSFKQSEEQIAALVSYVIHQSLRGQVEYRLTRLWLEELGDDEKPTDMDAAKELKELVKHWAADNASVYTPQVAWEVAALEGQKDNWARGRELFLTKGGCTDCHGKSGTADPKEAPNILAMKDDWGTPIKPRNYLNESFRGGKEPLDIFYRIKLGIKPSRMQAADTAKLSDADIWQLVGYVRSLEAKK